MFRRFTKKRVGVGLAAVSALVIAAGAYAYFSSTGTGTGSANVGKATAFTVGESGTPTGATALYPDSAVGTGNIQTHSYTVTNPSAGNQNLNQVVISVANKDGSAWSSQADLTKPACTAKDFSVGGQLVGAAWTDKSLAGMLEGIAAVFVLHAVYNLTALVLVVASRAGGIRRLGLRTGLAELNPRT